MSFERVVKHNAYTTNNMLIKVKDTLVSMGWTLYDDHSGDALPYYVFKSNGESGTEMDMYIRLRWVNTTNKLDIHSFRYWDAGTHTGTTYGYNSAYCQLNVDDNTTFDVWVYGNKDFVCLVTKVTGVYDFKAFGLLKKVNSKEITIIINDPIPGTDVNLDVSGVENYGFEVNETYQLVNKADGSSGSTGRSLVTIVQVTPGSGIIRVDNISTGTKIGSVLGANPQPVVVGNEVTFVPLNSLDASGVTSSAVALTRQLLGELVSGDPDQRGGKSALLSHLYLNTTKAHFGYVDSAFFITATTGLLCEDIIIVSSVTSGTVMTGTASTLQNNVAVWSVNEHVGRAVILKRSEDNTLRQVRKIISNTAGTLTVDANWNGNPANGNSFDISLEVCRFFEINGTGVAIKEV